LVTNAQGVNALNFDVTANREILEQQVTLQANTTYTLSAYIQDAIGAPGYVLEARNFSGATGTVLLLGDSLPDGRYSITFTTASDAAGSIYFGAGTTSNATGSITISQLQLEESSTATTYQRVTTATDYADVGAPVYLQFDGVDDQMVLSGNALSMSNNKPAFSIIIGNRSLGTDEMPVFFGSGTGGTRMNINTFTVNIYGSGRRLDADSFASAIRTATPSEDLVISALFRWFDAKLELRANQTSTVLDPFQTAGNSDSTDSAAILIGGPSYANVRLYAIIFRAADIAGTLLNQTERYVANKTGVSL
jgi:hypothetical protein